MLQLVAALWLGWVIHEANVQRHAVATIRAAGGKVLFDAPEHGVLGRLLEPLISDLADGHRPVEVWFRRIPSAPIGDDVWPSIGALHSLKKLHAPFGLVGNRGMRHLSRLHNLTDLDLRHTDIADESLCYLMQMRDLKRLSLSGTSITDAGLVYIEELASLTKLDLMGTRITDAGIVRLEALLSLEDINLMRTGVTDAAVRSLAHLRNLKCASLLATRITDEGARRLKRALSQCHVIYEQKTNRSITTSAIPTARVVDLFERLLGPRHPARRAAECGRGRVRQTAPTVPTPTFDIVEPPSHPIWRGRRVRPVAISGWRGTLGAPGSFTES